MDLCHAPRSNASQCPIGAIRLCGDPPILRIGGGSEQENGAWVAIMETTERQPFPGLYAVRALPWAREVLASKRPSMMGFLERLGSRLYVTPTGEAKWCTPSTP